MPTPKTGYKLRDGTRVPGVTTILGKFKDPGGLMHWAWEIGTRGLDYRKVRDEAADAGSIAHELVDCDIHGRDFDPSPYPPGLVALGRNSFEAYLAWKHVTRMRPIITEVQLVSETYRYGGTPDAIEVEGKPCILDWKTSNMLHWEYLTQLAAYGGLWTENFPERAITGGYHLLRFSRSGDFHHHFFAELEAGWEAFLLMRRLYDLSANLKRRAQ